MDTSKNSLESTGGDGVGEGAAGGETNSSIVETVAALPAAAVQHDGHECAPGLESPDRLLAGSPPTLCEACRQSMIQYHNNEINRLNQKRATRQSGSAVAGPYDELPTIDSFDAIGVPPLEEASDLKEIKLTKIKDGQYRKVKTWSKGAFGDASTSILLMTSDGGEFGYTGDAAIPLRLVFNSNEIIDILSTITDSDYLTAMFPVIVRPFKFLIYNEAKIRDANSQLRAACSARPDSTVEEKESQIADSSSQTDNDSSPKVYGLSVSTRARDIVQLVVDFMDHEMDDIFVMRKRIADRSVKDITFEYLPHLFQPGDLVVGNTGDTVDRQQAYRVLHVTGGRPDLDSRRLSPLDTGPMKIWSGGEQLIGVLNAADAHQRTDRLTPVIIDCLIIGFDGKKFGPRPRQFIIHEYKGLKSITSLDLYPLDFDTEGTEAKLIERGKEFARIAKYSHMYYDGTAMREAVRTWERSRVEKMHGQCIIDQETALTQSGPQRFYNTGFDDGSIQTNPLGFGLGLLENPTNHNNSETYERVSKDSARNRFYDDGETDVCIDQNFELDLRHKYITRTSVLQITTTATEEQYVLLPDSLWGYHLTSRAWYLLQISNLSPIQWRTERSAFEDLVLPSTHKTAVEALVRYQTKEMSSRAAKGPSKDASTLDLVQGKGHGLTILLHGMPGTGKTSTAECVAEQLQRPLFTITCGDLGTFADMVEERLTNYFHLAVKWSCVILLDEADVFLTHRTTGDYERNSIVSVFLRQLEYHSGVLILTTNRVGEFDEAISSRIHIKLHYPRLDRTSTMKIWEINIRRINENPAFDIKVNGTDILKFAERHWRDHETRPGRQWNGRQIKNSFQTAMALAFFEWESAPASERGKRPTLKRKHFKQVAETSVHFDRHMDKIHGAMSQGAFSKIAQQHGYRNDEEDHDVIPATPSSSAGRLSSRSKHAYQPRPYRTSLHPQQDDHPEKSSLDTASSEEASETDSSEDG